MGLTLSCPLSGIALMKFAPKRVVVISILLNAAAVFLFGIAHNKAALFVARFLIGFTQVCPYVEHIDAARPYVMGVHDVGIGRAPSLSMRRCGWMSSRRKGRKRSGCPCCKLMLRSASCLATCLAAC